MRLLVVTCLCVVLTATAFSQGQPLGWISIREVASPAMAESAQPQLSAANGAVILSWIEREGPKSTLKFAERTASGWSEPRVVSAGTDWFVNWADVPSVIRLGDGTLAAHWLQKSGPGTYAYDVRLAFSKDQGKTWSASVTPHHDGTNTEHGFASLFQMPGAGLGLVWLDGRAMKGEHAGHGSGDMSLRFTSFGNDGRQGAEVPLDVRVCECCPTSAVATSDGVTAAFRDRSPEEVRDIAIARLEGGKWTQPVPLHQDGWKVPACPVNGPVLSARGSNVAAAWFTVQNDEGRSFVAFSKDAGRTFGPPIRLDDLASLGRVDIELLPDGSAAASWIEVDQDRAQFRVRHVEPSGKKSAPVSVAGIESGRTSGYPRLAFANNELIFAWTARQGTLRVMTASGRGFTTGVQDEGSGREFMTRVRDGGSDGGSIGGSNGLTCVHGRRF